MTFFNITLFQRLPALIRPLAYLAAILAPLAWTGSLAAHPHVFIEQHLTVCFDDQGLAGFNVRWSFDEMFSIMIAEDFDADKNGTLDKKEVAVIREKAFGYIAPYNYYINVKIDGRPFAVKFIQAFSARLDQGKLSYEFFIPCHVRAAETAKQIVLAPYDPEYYSAIYFAQKHPLALEGTEQFTVETRISIDKSTSIYYDMVNPWAMFLEFRLK